MNRSNHLATVSRLAAVAVVATLAAIGTVQAAELHHTVVPADGVKWGPAPPSLPGGAQAAVLLGNPGKEGPFVLRLKFPAGYIVPPHRHTKDELVTVMAGKLAVNAGEKVNRATLEALPPGSFFNLPAGMPHYAWAEVETIVQIHGVGPFDVVYVNPKDDPRNVQKMSSR